MAMKRVYGRIEGDRLILPPEALEILPKEGEIYMITDSERGSVTAFAEDLGKIGDPTLYESLAALNEGLSEEDYLRPIPAEQLRRRKKNDTEGE